MGSDTLESKLERAVVRRRRKQRRDCRDRLRRQMLRHRRRRRKPGPVYWLILIVTAALSRMPLPGFTLGSLHRGGDHGRHGQGTKTSADVDRAIGEKDLSFDAGSGFHGPPGNGRNLGQNARKLERLLGARTARAPRTVAAEVHAERRSERRHGLL